MNLNEKKNTIKATSIPILAKRHSANGKKAPHFTQCELAF